MLNTPTNTTYYFSDPLLIEKIETKIIELCFCVVLQIQRQKDNQIIAIIIVFIIKVMENCIHL